jgi:hypothetical protein
MKTVAGLRVQSLATVAICLFASSAAGAAQKKATSKQEKRDTLLSSAMNNMNTGVWSVDGTVTSKNVIKLRGLLSGEDFDLTMEPGMKPNTPFRGIVIKDKAWICSDGETWHAGRPDDRLLYNWVHVPIMADRQLPPFERVGSEQRNGQTWLHVRLKVPEKKINPKELPQYWLVLDSKGQAQYVGHTEMPMFSQARHEVIYCSFDYAPAQEKIEPPQFDAPIDDKAYGFNDIEQHKFDWKNKIVRIEVTPKILGSEQIGENTYRAFLKDTAAPNHYGLVEFPHDALMTLGFLKKTVKGRHAWEDLEKMDVLGRTDGKPVSFYVQVIPMGEKPAARVLAVGATLIRDPDGTVSYTWDSPSLHPTTSDQSDADSKSNSPPGMTTVTLLDGKLELAIPADFSRDPDDPKEPKTVAKFSGPDSAWGIVLRGTHGLTPDKLDGYLKMRVAEYSKGFNWLPKDSHLQWLKKDIVTIHGRQWADWRYVPMLKGRRDYSRSPVYTRFLTTSYRGQLLEISFTSNLNTDPKLKEQIDHIMDSVHLEDLKL